jgi:hypothetical protein
MEAKMVEEKSKKELLEPFLLKELPPILVGGTIEKKIYKRVC